jgi:hypothetical protein
VERELHLSAQKSAGSVLTKVFSLQEKKIVAYLSLFYKVMWHVMFHISRSLSGHNQQFTMFSGPVKSGILLLFQAFASVKVAWSESLNDKKVL